MRLYITLFKIRTPVKSDKLVKSQKTPSPLADFAIVALATTAEMGEGWGEGEKYGISVTYIPLPLIPSRQGRG
jgi:hypothetical protein